MTSSDSTKKKSDMTTAPKRRRQCCDLFVVKNMFLVCNVTLLLSGVCLSTLGVWTLISKQSLIGLLTTSMYETILFLFIGIGLTIAVLVFSLGCCGALHENGCCLTWYAFCLLTVILLESISGIMAYFYEATLEEELTNQLNNTMLEFYRRDSWKTETIDSMQIEFRCCGAGSFSDWLDNWTSVPDSCCKSYSPDCATKSHHPSNINYKGCITSLAEYLGQHLGVLGAVAIGFCGSEIFGIIFSCCLAKIVYDKKERRKNLYWRRC